MIWFSRNESDRRGWFMSDSSIRSNLDLERFYEIQIPIPDKKLQEAVVTFYEVYITRKKINEQLKTQIKNICPILIRGSLEEGRYNDKGLPITKSATAKEKEKCLEKLELLKEQYRVTAAGNVKADMPFGDWMDLLVSAIRKTADTADNAGAL